MQVTAPGDTNAVVAARKNAAAATGSDFNYLVGTAMRESCLKTNAQSAASWRPGEFFSGDGPGTSGLSFRLGVARRFFVVAGRTDLAQNIRHARFQLTRQGDSHLVGHVRDLFAMDDLNGVHVRAH